MKRLSKVAAQIENAFDVFMYAFKKRLGTDKPLQIITYRTYGTINRLFVRGRLIEDKQIQKATAQDSIFHNLLSMYQRFESDEVPGAHLRINLQGKQYVVETDDEGYFVLNVTTDMPLQSAAMWYEVEVELINSPFNFQPGLKSLAEVLIPPDDAEYGIISDIDDTIVKTTATNLLAMSRNTFFHNAHTRLPFAGVSEFYKALQLGRNGKRNNPFFYVSSSPWNLYDLLVDFMDLNDIPEGPLLLRDFGLEHDKVGISDHMGHKFKEITNILQSYPHLKFVLIGDSGQEDPKIYREVIRKFPNRILAVYIRDVQLPEREQIAVNVAHELESHQVEMIIADTTIQAAEHAARIGLIFKEAILPIIKDKKLDKGEEPGKEELPVVR